MVNFHRLWEISSCTAKTAIVSLMGRGMSFNTQTCRWVLVRFMVLQSYLQGEAEIQTVKKK